MVIRGRGVMPGYVNNPAATADAFFGDWFRTGDRGVLRDGYLFLEGRLKEMILRGGENISPAEVEQALLAHPAVKDAVCFGVADEKYGELVSAAVTLQGEAEVEGPDRPLQGTPRGVQGSRDDSCSRRDPAHRDRQDPAAAGRGVHRGGRR